MAHISERAVASMLALALGCLGGACDEDASEPTEGPQAGGKADELNPGAPIQPLVTGQTVQGHASGTAVTVYVVSARPGSVVNARVERTDGDLDPTAFLYRGLSAARGHNFEAPSHGFFNSTSVIEAGWKLPTSFTSTLLLIVSAGGDSSGDFTIELTCHPESPVPCSSDGVEDELDACEFVREAFARCEEDDCDDFLAIEDTTQDDECCELWVEHGLPGADFCP